MKKLRHGCAGDQQKPSSVRKRWPLRKMKTRVKSLLVLALTIVAGCTTAVHDPFGNSGTETSSEWQYTGDLHKAISKATRFRLLIGPPGRTFPSPLLDSTDKALVREIKNHIVIKARNTTGTYMCDGNYTLEWLRDDTVLAQVSLIVGDVLRWEGHWEGDAKLTPDSELWLCRFVMQEVAFFTEKLNEANQSAHGTR